MRATARTPRSASPTAPTSEARGGEREAKNARDGRAHERGNRPSGDGRWIVEREDSLEEAEEGRYERLYAVLAYRMEPAVDVVPAGPGGRRR